MKTTLLFALLFITTISFGQIPKLYIQLVSHNEPADNLQYNLNYSIAKANMLTMAAMVNTYNVKWNVQTSDGFVLGALVDQAATSTNIFKTLANAPYVDNIQIDPRYKNMNGRNIADQWYLLDSLGANPSHSLGGCIYSSTDIANHPLDWEEYRVPIIGNIYGNSWQCDLITGAGSYPPHDNDYNNFGCFKPKSEADFTTHDPSKNLWCIGVGCAPVLTDTTNEQEIIDLILGQVDSIQTGKWPADKFYVMRIMTNQSDYGSAFFTKLQNVLDGLAGVPYSELQWATIGESFAAFQAWQTTSSDFSQWGCGETMTGIIEPEKEEDFTIYPNPSSGVYSFKFADNESHSIVIADISGKIVLEQDINSNQSISIENNQKGMYFVNVDKQDSKILIKE